jgi:hypothetical protein
MAGNTDHVLATLNRHGVNYLLIGGANFLLRHSPILTYDIDVWIEDAAENRRRCEAALAELRAEWGESDDDWGPVTAKKQGWLDRRSVCCLTSPFGAIDVFRSVAGLNSWSQRRGRANADATAGGISFLGLSDHDMLACQLALPEGQRNEARIQYLQGVLQRSKDAGSLG